MAELEGMATAASFLSMRATDFAELIRKNLGVEVTTFVFAAGAVKQVVANIQVELLDRLMKHRASLESVAIAVVERPAGDILQLKPTLWGIGVDLKALWRKWTSK